MNRPGAAPRHGLAPPGPSASASGRDAEAPVHPPRRLVVVSNRLPFTLVPHTDGVRFVRSAGGLVAALEPALAKSGGVWIGWPGTAQEARSRRAGVLPPGPSGVRYVPVPLTEREVSLYYAGFSNRTLWPLFHYFVGRTRIDARTWEAYDQLNARFAQVAAEASDDESLVWIHDYQLLRAPLHLRTIAPRRRIAFFLHIPFPAQDVFRLLPWARQVMRGMLAADLVGFHVPDYAAHFLACAERLLGCEVDRAEGVVYWEGRAVTVQAHPIGIDVEGVEALAAGAEPVSREGAAGLRTIVGVDRLDYTKGIYERLLALETLLERYPAYRRKIVFTQILVPSREHVDEYRALKREIDETVGRINGRFSDQGWTPIRYLARSLAPAELATFYRQADIALVTPLRDGMNLVAKEYIAAQVDDDGVLILSELAGAAQELQEAVLVNPFDIDAVAEALHVALAMPAEERRARTSALRDRVRANTVQMWVSRFLETTERATARARQDATSPAERVLRRLRPWLAQRPVLALFLDYDGTLTPIVPRPEDAVLSEGAREAVRQALVSPNVDVTIVSGRSLADVRQLVGVPGLTYVGNHGFEIEGPGISHRPEGLDRHVAAVDAAADALAALDIPGARVERKRATLSFHTREVADAARADAERRAVEVLRRHHLRITRGKRVVEGRPPVEWGKGHAVLHVLTQRHGANWPARVRALYVGDDVTDEDAFRSLKGIGRSIFVGALAAVSEVQPDHVLPDPAAVIQLLRRLGAGPFADATA